MSDKIFDLDTPKEELLDEIYHKLLDLNNNLNTNISKEKIKIKVQELIIRIGGRR